MTSASKTVSTPTESPVRHRWLNHHSVMWAAILFVAAVLGFILLGGGNDQQDVIQAAYAMPDGGGYCALGESGVPQPIVHKGIMILKASKGGSYCCGFTFFIAMKIAEERGLLEDKSAYEVSRFQQEWYGATKASKWRQAAMAMENLGIGRQVDPADARPGDFVAVHRIRGAGHSVIFLDWVRHDGVIVGFKYRSSQPSTSGVGDQIEYFTTSGYKGGSIPPKWFFVARLDES